jgi:undecaprenyl-diphosphatase
MDLFQVVLLALVQALTEFLPISSTAHLVLVPWLMGWEDFGLFFDVALHVGTLLAVLVYFAKTWIRLLGLAVGRRVLIPESGHPDLDLYENPKLFWFLVAATFPAGIAGLALKNAVETTLRNPLVIGVMLIAVGILIWAVERRATTRRNLDSLTFGDAMLVGLAQALALVPGTSRSGITIATGLLLGITRSSAARFSFLLSSPIILGAALKTAYDAMQAGSLTAQILPALGLGIVVSACAGYAVIAFFLKYLQTSTLTPFVYYRVGFGIMVIALAYSSASLPAAFMAD